MTLTPTVTKFLAVLTIIGDILILCLFLFIAWSYVTKKKTTYQVLLQKYGLWCALVIAVIATSGSLFFSEIAGFEPCKLCWFQRIFMYPQVLLLGIALYRKDNGIIYSIIPMSVIGAGIAAYHYAIQKMPHAISCGDGAVSCSTMYFFHFGYITIPVMALTAFILIGLFALLSKPKGSVA